MPSLSNVLALVEYLIGHFGGRDAMRSRVLFSSRFCTLAFVVCISHLVHGQDVVTGAATNVASNWVTLNGTANPNGSSAYVYFVYGVTSRYENKTERLGIGSGTTPVPVSINVANLPPGRTFHYKLVMNSTYGGDQAFTTLAAGSPPAWRSVQVTAQDDVARANMADGARTGAAHNDWQVYFYKVRTTISGMSIGQDYGGWMAGIGSRRT